MKQNVPIQSIISAWKGHETFANWLVETVNPTTTVELGVDYGFSLFALAIPERGHVYGIDLFGDYQKNYTGDLTTKPHVEKFIQDHNFTNITLIQDDFANVARTWNRPVDILHIDGTHTHEAISQDWANWSGFVLDHGMIIMHDVIYFAELTRFYNEITWHKAYFEHSAGLGLATRNSELLSKACQAFPNCKPGNIPT